MWLQDMKPRKNVSVAAPSSMHSSANQRVPSTSSPQEVAKIPKQSPQSGMETHFATHKPSTGKWVSVDRFMCDGFSKIREQVQLK